MAASPALRPQALECAPVSTFSPFSSASSAMFALGLAVLSGTPTLVRAAPVQTSQRSTPVEGVVVRGRRIREVAGIDVTGGWCPMRGRGASTGPPRVVDSYPRPGDVIAPGPTTLSLTFDRPMNCGWAMTYNAQDEFCMQIGMWDMPGRRTWQMECNFAPDHALSVRFGAVKGHGFSALAGAEAAPFALNFATGPVTGTGSAVPAVTPEPARPEQAGRLHCPEHRLRGSGPRCRYVPASTATEP